MDDAIRISGLGKTYRRLQAGVDGEVHAIDGIDLAIREGEFVGVFGPNGCGKTTMLLCIAGVEDPTAGTVEIRGRPPEEAVIGFVFQNYREALLPWRTCLDNVAFPLEIAGKPRSERHAKARELVQSLGLKIDLDSFPYQQSGGQQQLVAIARALISEPDILIMDEPLSSLDVKARLSMRAIIEDIWLKTRKTTIYVSHDVDDSVYLSDRIVILSERPGRIVKVIANPIPHPRGDAVGGPQFNQLRNEILSVFAREGESE